MNLPERYVKTTTKFTNGGMSSAMVYHDIHLDRDVVVKLLHSNTDQKRLLDEIRALSTIRSKHVVEIYDIIVGKNNTIRALVEEFVPGASLNTKAGDCNTNDVLRLAFALASGLADIHDSGHIHRDVKPENMKLDASGCLKIFDFGLARAEHQDAATVGIVGTLGYLAPELCVDDEDNVVFTKAVDVFAFASTVLVLMRGSLPKGLRTIPPELPSAKANFKKQTIQLPVVLGDLLNRCHSAIPADRPSIAEVRDLIAAHLLFNQHRATIVLNGQLHQLDAVQRAVNIAGGPLGAFSVSYDGLGFHITQVSGSVFLNNMPVVAPFKITGSCVITLGSSSHGHNREYVTIDVSHPEVIS